MPATPAECKPTFSGKYCEVGTLLCTVSSTLRLELLAHPFDYAKQSLAFPAFTTWLLPFCRLKTGDAIQTPVKITASASHQRMASSAAR